MTENIINSFRDSVERLREILQAPKTVANRDSAIKRFELTFELAWKSIQGFMKREGLLCRSPRESFRQAFKYGLMSDDGRWLEMIDDRNQTVHTYSEKLADQVYGRLPGYLELFRELATKIDEAMKEPDK